MITHRAFAVEPWSVRESELDLDVHDRNFLPIGSLRGCDPANKFLRVVFRLFYDNQRGVARATDP